MNRLAGGFLTRIDKAGEDLADLLDGLAAKFEPRIRAAFLRAIEDIRSKVDVPALRDAIARNDMPEVLRLLGLTGAQPFGGVLDPVRSLYLDAGKAAAETKPGRLEVRWDMLEPRTVGMLREYGARLIAQITNDTREGVMEVVAGQLAAGANPRTVATRIGQMVGLTRSQARAVLSYRRALQELKAEALVRRLRDGRFDRTVARAIERGEGLPAKTIDLLVKRYQERALRRRGETIARTESIRAANLANYAAMRQAIDQGRVEAATVTRRWVVARDERTCPTCKAVPKLNPNGVGMVEPFQTPIGVVQHPPLHPNCRCVVTFRLKVD